MRVQVDVGQLMAVHGVAFSYGLQDDEFLGHVVTLGVGFEFGQGVVTPHAFTVTVIEVPAPFEGDNQAVTD